jgi:photosystem II stability/assembly factor-like uncharacterized protein
VIVVETAGAGTCNAGRATNMPDKGSCLKSLSYFHYFRSYDKFQDESKNQMKKIYFIFSIVVLFMGATYNCMGQWTTVYQNNNTQLYDAAFPTDLTGFVAASDTGVAVVLRTNDGGITWNKKYILGWGFIDKIVMTDSVSGYLIRGGVTGKILKTSDGFNTYTVHNTDSSFIVKSLSLVNDSTGFFLNNAAKLRKFEHYGASYTHIIDTLSAGGTVQFVNSHTGYLDDGTRLLMTSDTGVTWNFVNSNLGFQSVVFNFADSLSGYFSDFNTIYKTNDGGIAFPLQYNFPGTYDFAVNGNFCMAANDAGNVAYTTDGGLIWQTETTGINFIVNGVYNVITTPGGYCFMLNSPGGEIKKRPEPLVAGIYNPAGDFNIAIYPNPFTSQTTISFSEQQRNTRIRITDIFGKEIKTINFSGKQLSTVLEEMKVGIYFLTITGERKSIVHRKIIIQ